MDTIDALRDTGATIWILREVPTQRWNVPDVLASTVWRGQDVGNLGLPIAEYRQQFHRQSQIFEGISTRFPGVALLDPTDLLVSNNLCRVVKNGQALYTDDNHLTVAGAMLLKPLFDPIFASISK